MNDPWTSNYGCHGAKIGLVELSAMWGDSTAPKGADARGWGASVNGRKLKGSFTAVAEAKAAAIQAAIILTKQTLEKLQALEVPDGA